MNIFGQIGGKIIWFVIALLIGGAVYVYVLKNFLDPPRVATIPPTSATPLVPSTPSFSPATTPKPIANDPLPVTTITPISSATPSPVVNSPSLPKTGSGSVPNNSSPSPQVGASPNSSTMPALALSNQVAIKVPKNLEKGGVLKIYLNNDNSQSPDPVEYSPSKSLKVPGLSLINTNTNQFEQASGYFLVNKAGDYNITIILPQNSYFVTSKNLRIQIDGQPLPSIQGGRVTLAPGWHQANLFVYGSTNIPDANLIRVSWALEGENLQPLQVWREP